MLCQRAVFTPFSFFSAFFLLRKDRRWFRKYCHLNSMRMKENKEFKEVQMRRSSRFELEGAAGGVAGRRRHNGYTFPTLWLETRCTFATHRRTLFLYYSSTSSHDSFHQVVLTATIDSSFDITNPVCLNPKLCKRCDPLEMNTAPHARAYWAS